MPDIHAVCKEAKSMGYEWASLLNADVYRDWKPKQGHFLNALWFSRISHEDEDIDGLVEYSEYDETYSYSPLWYEFIQTSYTTAIQNYADRDLIFAKPVMDSMLCRVPPPADPE